MVPLTRSELNQLAKKLPLHTLRGRIYDLLDVDRGGCKKKTRTILKKLAKSLNINDNATYREFWEILYIYFSEIAISKNHCIFFNPCRDEPPENKKKLSPTEMDWHRKYLKSDKGRKSRTKARIAHIKRGKNCP